MANHQCVLLAGGKGTRLAEETYRIPKPMVTIGNYPIIWHIMKYFYHYGVRDFIICLGYKGYYIKEYFANYALHHSDITVSSKANEIKVLKSDCEDWKITLVDTGQETMTGGRLLKAGNYLKGNDFFFTYGDGLSNVDLNKLVELHQSESRLATVTATNPPSRFGTLSVQEKRVLAFREKPKDQNTWINGGFFFMSPKVLNFISGDTEIWEQEPMKNLVKKEQLSVFKHSDFWQPMDTIAEKTLLNELWEKGEAPWKIWN